MYEGHICDVPGIELGHEHDEVARTGVSVILCKEGAVGGVDVRGGSPGTRETDLLRPENTVDVVHAVALCGGSAFGLSAADGVMRRLEEMGIGYDAGVVKVPIVCAAVLFDLAVGDANIRPDAQMGYAATDRATRTDRRQGAVGAGCGATVGKALPGNTPAQSGIGSASIALPDGVVVGALVAVNALGDVYEPHTGALLACGTQMGQSLPLRAAFGGMTGQAGTNTTIGVVATNAKLTKAEANRLASAAQDGMVSAIQPVHTPYDGDALFALSTGELLCNPLMLQMAAVEVVSRAIANAILALKENA